MAKILYSVELSVVRLVDGRKTGDDMVNVSFRRYQLKRNAMAVADAAQKAVEHVVAINWNLEGESHD